MRGIAAALLVFEGLVVLFATLVALDLSDVADGTLWAVGGGLAALLVLAAGLLGRPWGYALGSALQAAVVAAGIVVPVMFFLGLLFAALWFFALHLGRRVRDLEARRAGAPGAPSHDPQEGQ